MKGCEGRGGKCERTEKRVPLLADALPPPPPRARWGGVSLTTAGRELIVVCSKRRARRAGFVRGRYMGPFFIRTYGIP